MKRHLNTLYVTSQGAYLAKQRETVVVRVDGEAKLRIPFRTLDGIVAFGNVGCSPFLMGACGRRGVTLSFLTERGRFLARSVGETTGNVLLRREQYRRAGVPSESLEIARPMVAAKLINSRRVLQRSLRDHPGNGEDVRSRSVHQIGALLGDVDGAGDLDTLRGLEGQAARQYFSALDAMILQRDDALHFQNRNRRPPTDPVNALLSFSYALLRHDLTSACEAVGLDPQVGFLHQDRPGRPGLALDLLEEVRPALGDRLVLTLLNRRQLLPGDFVREETGGVRLKDGARKTFLVAYQKRKQEELRHPFLGEKTTYGLLFHLQAQLLARTLRGDLDAYPPFILE